MRKVIEHFLTNIPENYPYLSGESEGLADYELDGLDVDEVWYWYSYGYYEGSGFLIARKGQKWGSTDLGHCSCYGPTEHGISNWVDSYTELKSQYLVNREYWKEVEAVFNLVEKG